MLEKKFEITDLGDLKLFLGLHVNYDQNAGVLKLSQEHYINNLLKYFDISPTSKSVIPMQTNKAFNDPSAKISTRLPFRQLIGALAFLAGGTRPDISFAVHYLQQWQNDFTKEHYTAALKILSYCGATKGLCLTYHRNPEAKLSCYSDASFSNCRNGAAMSGYVLFDWLNPITWKSGKQHLVANSTGFAEVVAPEDAISKSVWLSNLKQELNDDPLSILDKVTILCDSKAAVDSAHKATNYSKMKTILNKTAFIRQHIDELNTVSIIHIAGCDNIADIFTKALPRPTLIQHRNHLLKEWSTSSSDKDQKLPHHFESSQSKDFPV